MLLKQEILEAFDLVQVINLPSRSDRRAQIARQLARIGLSFDDGSAEILPASRFEDRGGFETIGARGCFDSHLRALRLARQRKVKALLILEDDCDFASAPVAPFRAALEALQGTGWSIFYGGYLKWSAAQAATSPVSRAGADDPIQGAHFIAFAGTVLPALIGYLEAMLEREPGSPEGGPMHVDGAYCWFRRAHPHLETWVAEPPLGFQRPSRTDVHDLRYFDRLPMLREAAALLRRIKRAVG